MRLQPSKKHISAVFKRMQGKVASKGLASEVGIHLNTVYNYRSDNPPEQLVKFIRLCEAMGYDVNLVKR